jgi:hypothetical protein
MRLEPVFLVPSKLEITCLLSSQKFLKYKQELIHTRNTSSRLSSINSGNAQGQSPLFRIAKKEGEKPCK